jgi:hypothetical protein
VWLDTRQHSGHSTSMDFVFALAVPVSIAGESVASRVSASLLATMCQGVAAAELVCALMARNVDDYGMMLRRVLPMSHRKVFAVLYFGISCVDVYLTDAFVAQCCPTRPR